MVRLAFAAINASPDTDGEEQNGETLEAQEARVADSYMRALQLVQDGRTTEAQDAFEALLVEPLLAESNEGAGLSMASAKQLKHVIFKNLAALLAESDESAMRALQLYGQALLLDDGDAVVWNRMGTLAAECGLWGVARNVFEHGLARHPRHALMLEKLVEVVLQLGDWHAASPLIKRILHRDPGHPRAQKLSTILEHPSAAGPDDSGEADAKAVLQPRFRQRLQLEQLRHPNGHTKGHRQVTLQNATWAALLQTLTDLIKGPNRGSENAAQLSAGESVTLQLPAEEMDATSAAEETVGERLPELKLPGGSIAGAPGGAIDAEPKRTAAAHDQAEKLPPSPPTRRGRRDPKVARKCIPEFVDQPPSQDDSAQGQSEPTQATEGASGAAQETGGTAQEKGHGSSAEGAAEVDRGGANGEKGVKAEETGRTPRKDAHVPSRASRRLEARREGRGGTDDEGNGGSEAVNIIAMLLPFLPKRPQPDMAAASGPAGSGAQTPGSAGPAAAPQLPATGGNAAKRSREEERDVRAFLLARPPKESLHSLGAAAVQELASDPSRRIPPEALPKLMELAAALGSGWRPMPAVALSLAELHLDRAALFGPSAAVVPPADATAAQEGAQPTASVAVSAKGPASKRNRAAQEAVAAAHVRACETFLGAFLMDMLQSPAGDRSSANGDDTALQRPQLARHQWALGRLAELRRDFAAAAGHYFACQHLCKGIGASEGSSEREPLQIHCVNLEKDGQISATAAAAKVEGLQLFEVLESSKRNLSEERPQSVIAELAPALLGDDVAASRALRSDRKTFLDALQMLQDAATSVEDAPLELRCRLVALTHLLPALSADLADESAHTASAAGPPPTAVKDAGKPVKILLTQALTELAEFVSTHARSEAGLQALAPHLEALKSQELPQVQWRVAVLVERYYWSLCQAPARGAVGRSLSGKDAGRQAALLAAVSALCALSTLRMSARRQLSRADISAEEALMRAASEILAARRALTQQHGAWVKACLTQLGALLQALKEVPAEGHMDQEGNSEEAEGTATLDARVEGALAQCLHVLYGVELPHRDPDWGSMEDQVVARVAMRTPEECLDAWRYIRPYAEGIAHDKKALGRLQGVLQAMQKHFKAPPQAVLDAWRPDALLDNMGEQYLLQEARPTAVQKLLAPPPELQQAVAADEHAGVHAILHHLLLRLQPDLDVLLKEDFALLPAGAAAVENYIELACFDLRYNPLRYFAWDRIAVVYREASEGILKMAAEELPVEEWHADTNADLRERFELYQRRAARATLVARQLCPAEDVVFQDEQIAMVLHERLQNAPPLYDQLARVPDRVVVQRLAAQAAQACERAIEGLPDEWMYHMFLGKMRAKCAFPPEQYLPDMARACSLASVHAGGLVEPLYRLHATRLKILQQPQSLEPAALALIARYCFDEEKQQRAAALMQQITAGQGAPSVGELVNLLVADCEAALRWCLEKDKGFHKAHHALARSLQARGSFREAAEELRHLFTTPKRNFCISMWEIGDRLTKAAGGEVERQSDEGASSALTDDESSWGRQPPRTAGNGLDESHRKFAACRRKYLIRYLDLLARTGNHATLAAAHSFLASPQQWSNPSMMADLARLALGRCITTLASQLRQHCPTIAPPAFQNPPGERTIQSGQIPGLVPGLLPGAAAGPSAPFGNGQMPLSFLGVPIGEQAGNSMPAQQLAVSDEALPVLEAAYGLYMDHFVLGGNEHGANHWTAALEAVQPVDTPLVGWITEAALARGALGYIDELGRRGNLDELQARLAAVRKRCKVLRTANEKVQALAARIASAAAAALAAALPDLDRRQAGAMPSQASGSLQPDQTFSAQPQNQAAVSLLPNQAMLRQVTSGQAPSQSAFSWPPNVVTSGQPPVQAWNALPGPGSPRAPFWAAPAPVRVAGWQPQVTTPAKTLPGAAMEHSLQEAATPPPQAAAAVGHAPMHTDAVVQQASLELLRHAHYLYKSGVARLPAAGSSGLPGAGSLCRLDELLVRAYKLYRGPQRAGSAVVTAADAAAAYDELARATRRSSPAGKGSGPATRAAAEGSRLPLSAPEMGREPAAQPMQAARIGGKDALQAPEKNAQGSEEGTARETDAPVQPGTPLTRKRSRQEADVAEADANFGAASRGAPTLADPTDDQIALPHATAGEAQGDWPGAAQPALNGVSADRQAAGDAAGGLVQSSALAVPIGGPGAWEASVFGALPAGAPLAAQPSDGVGGAAQSGGVSVGVDLMGSEFDAPAAKRLRPDA